MPHLSKKWFGLVIFLFVTVSLKAQSFSNEIQQIRALLDKNQYDSAQLMIEHSWPEILTKGLPEEIAQGYLLKHDLNWHTNQFDSATVHLSRAIKIYSEIPDSSMLAYANQLWGYDFLVTGQFEKSVEGYQNAIEIYRALHDTALWASNLSYLGNTNHDIAEYKQGIAYASESWNLLNAYSVNEPDKKAYALNIIAINYDDMGDSEKAIEYHLKIIDMLDELQDYRSKARVFNNIGNSLMKLGRYDEAIGYLKKNLAINEQMGRKYGLATVKTNLGTLSYLNKQYPESQSYLDEAEKLSFEINDVEKIHDVLFQQYMLYKSWGKFDQSLEYMERFHAFKDSIFNERKSQQIAELQTRYETQKKEQQIILQDAKISEQHLTNQRNVILMIAMLFVIALLGVIILLNRSRSRKKHALLVQEAEIKLRETQIEAAITSQEKERTRFAQDLHDGFGQMISILNLNLKSLETKETDRHLVFEQSSQVLEEMYQELKGICFNLMPQTLIKSGIEAAVKEFAARVNQTEKLFIETDFFGLEERLTEVQEISLYRITQEWINNILKYSDADKISVQITKDDVEITLLIEDNGIGFDPELLKNSKGNGWRNMNSRANLIKGELELDTQPGTRGNTLVMNVPALVAEKVVVN